jgi:hypothetical protein
VKILALPNQAVEATFELALNRPDLFPKLPSFPSKEAYRAWCHHPKTDHAFLNGNVGQIPGIRVSKSNPVTEVQFLIADWDSPEAWNQREAFKELPVEIRPNYLARTFSGGVRGIWILEEPMNVWDRKLLLGFMHGAAKRLKLSKPVGGFDRGAWLSPYTYYEVGTQWEILKEDPLSSAIVRKLMMDAVDKEKPNVDESNLKWEDIAAEVERRCPGRWPGSFEVGARGPRFWDPESKDPTAAIVRPDGVTYFSDGGGFMSWLDLFGRDWVRKHADENIGTLLKDVWFDGKNYYTPNLGDAKTNWLPKDLTRITRHLKVECGFSTKTARGEVASPMDKVLHYVEQYKVVEGCFPLVYFRDKVVQMNGKRLLNSSSKRPVQPVEGPREWGQDFPFTADYIDRFFIDEEQKGIFLAWFAFMYQHALNGKPHNGQNLFIVGPPNKGKTLMTNRLVGGVMGGSQDAGAFLLGSDQFSGSLFEYGIWTVDDESASNDRKAKEKFSAALKKMAANPQVNIRAMYQQAQSIEWYGRVMITANDDPESLRLLPSIEISNSDKMIMLRCSPEGIQFPDNVVDELNKEMPFFCAWLRDHKIPEEFRGDSRYGVISYCDPLVREEIKDQSPNTHILELVEPWRELYFNQQAERKDGGEKEWHGTITNLIRSLEQVFGDERKAMEGINRWTLSRALTVAQSSGIGWVRHGKRRWRSIDDPTVKIRHGVSICAPGYQYTGTGFDIEKVEEN